MADIKSVKALPQSSNKANTKTQNILFKITQNIAHVNRGK